VEPLIQDYEISLAEPGCAPGAPRWGALAAVKTDISPVMPYLNAVWKGARYDHQNRVLIHDRGGQKFALRPHEIRAAWVENVGQAYEVIEALAAEINRIWADRERITPDESERLMPDAMSLFKLLPRTNCRACGYASCLAFAVALRGDEAAPEDCPSLTADQMAGLRKLLK
jgi:ArsR family metal-binding transcriptional regulator